MTSRRSIIFFWGLFLIPTLIMAGAAAKLLFHEQERIGDATLLALTERAEVVSRSVHLTVETVKENLIGALIRIPPARLKETLLEWEETNPLVRNVFIFNNDNGLVYPVRSLASTREERRFTVRYDALFTGRVSFEATSDRGTGDQAGSGPVASYRERRAFSSQDQLVALSKAAQQPSMAGTAPDEMSIPADSAAGPRSGWLPWFSENRLYVLIWVRSGSDGPVYGLELELITLLSRLVVDFPMLDNSRAALVLMDGNQHHVHQSGSLELPADTKPSARVPVSERLPHWQIGVFLDKKSDGSANGFLILSLILVGIFIAAIVSGGILLTRMTLKNMKDAQQKTSFVSSVSHELKTPLTSIRMYAELILSGRVKAAAKKEKYLSVIVSESERLTRLINNVLDFGKLEQGKKSYCFTTFEMDAFLYRVIEAHAIRIRKKGLEIVTTVKEGDFTVHTDRDAIEQVVVNLLDNALKYAGNGRFIEFNLEKEPDGALLFKIRDDGPGIPESQASMIFKKFHRIDDSLTAGQPGSGLGLSITRQILRDLGGDLSYEPMKKNGSCFTARIKDHGTD